MEGQSSFEFYESVPACPESMLLKLTVTELKLLAKKLNVPQCHLNKAELIERILHFESYQKGVKPARINMNTGYIMGNENISPNVMQSVQIGKREKKEAEDTPESAPEVEREPEVFDKNKYTWSELSEKNVIELKTLAKHANISAKDLSKSELVKRLMEPENYQKNYKKARISPVVSVLKMEATVSDMSLSSDRLEKVNPSIKAGVLISHIPLNEGKDTTLLVDKYIKCNNNELTTTVRDTFIQPFDGFSYNIDDDPFRKTSSSSTCSEDCEGIFLSGTSNDDFEYTLTGGHNQCIECPDFGQCSGGYAHQHCQNWTDHSKCTGHLVRQNGSFGDLKCNKCGIEAFKEIDVFRRGYFEFHGADRFEKVFGLDQDFDSVCDF